MQQLLASEQARAWVVLGYVAVGIGCVLRILRWVDNPALWLDEAFLSLNVIDKPFADIVGSLDFLQSAPPGFLLAEKLVETIIGDGEQALRLLPLLASVASVFFFAYVARRLVAPPAAVFAIALFAAGEPLLERAAEVKQYSVDVAVATLIAALAVWAINAPSDRIVGRAGVLGVVSLITLWLSFPAAFSFAAAVAALGAYAWQIESRRLIVAATIVGAAGLAAFGVVYAIASSNVSRISAAIFAGGDASSRAGRLDTIQDAWSTLVNPGGFDNGTNALAALLAVFGVIGYASRSTLHLLVLITVPLFLAGIADAINRYPLGGRFSLFLAPFLILLVARGAQELVSWSRRKLLVATALAVVLAAPPLSVAAYHAARPPARQDIKPLLDTLIENWRDRDTVYVYRNSQYALRYYATCMDCRPSRSDFPWPIRKAPPSLAVEQFAPALESVPPSVIVGSGTSPTSLLADAARLPGSGRVWLLFSHVESHDGLDGEQLLLRSLERNGEVLGEAHARGARLYLIERRPA